jgi:serine/threonine-protein kinase
MSTPSAVADRNLIFGLLALQMDFVTREQLLDAMHAWMLDKQTPVGEILCRRGVLDSRRTRALDALVEMHVEQHGNPQASLAVLRVEPAIRRDLGQIDDPEVQASLAGLPSQDSPATGDGKAEGDFSVLATTAPVGDAACSIRYRRLREHAKGGLGEVFVALDSELDREVALKEIQTRHADHPESRARFLTEARVTGALEHPGIVPVYGLGVYPDGRPYYAMRFIKGDSLKDAIDTFHAPQAQDLQSLGFHSLAFRQLLRRFVDVCNAMAYAHDKGVIHRDLKPANVMLGKFGETLVVDWGLAKVMGQADAEATTASVLVSSGDSSFTQAGQALGTPAFMSPEQAAGRLDRVGPASDTYSLGATLYCLLTGRAPYTEKDVGVVLAKVQNGDFKPPRQVNASAPAALEAVCLKAMALKPEDRYSSPHELKEEIEHWLADEPVTAYREPLTFRVRRWARQHRTLVSSLVVLAVAAVGGLAAVLAVQRQANADLAAKNAELAAEQAKVEERFELAQKAIALFHTGVSEDILLKGAEFKEQRTKLLKEAAGFYADLEKLLAGQTDVKSRKALAAAYFQLGTLTGTIGDYKEALAVHRKALALRRERAAAEGAGMEARLDVARSLRAEGLALFVTRDPTGALRAYEEARDIATALEAESAADEVRTVLAQIQYNIGFVLFRTGKPTKALEAYQKALAIRQKLADANLAIADYQSDLAMSLNEIGLLLMHTGKPEEALTACRKALAVHQRLTNANPRVIRFRYGLANSHDYIGWCLLNMGRPVEAAQAAGKALDIMQKLVDDYPAIALFQDKLANYHINIGRALDRQKRLTEAFTALDKGVDMLEKLGKADPAFYRELGESLAFRGGARVRAGRPAEAAADLRRALELWAKLSRLDIEIQVEWSRALSLLAGLGGDAKSGVMKDEARTFAIQSVAVLADAVKAGWALPSELKEPDFDVLRGRDDFKKLLAEVEANSGWKAKPVRN